MDKSKFRISGIYNEESFDLCNQLGIDEFGLDFRPRSMNFFPGYRFINLLNSRNSVRHRYFLHYAYESELAIFKMLADIKEKTAVNSKQLILIFSEDREGEFFRQFQLPFAHYFKNCKTLERLLLEPLFREVIFSYQEIEYLCQKGQGILFLKQVYEMCADRPDLHVTLKLPWEFDMVSSIFDFFHFDSYLLSICPQMEKSYRHLDEDKFFQGMSSIRSQLADIIVY